MINIGQLRRELRPLNMADATQLSPTELEYRDYYRLPTQQQFPQHQHQLGVVHSPGFDLAVQVWLQPRAQKTLLVVHGYFDHVGLFGHLIRYGLERGYSVVAFDLPGHGLSSGEPGVIDDFAQYRRAIEAVVAHCASLPGDWHVIAQSTGGGVIMDCLLRGGDALFSRAALLAPLIRPRGWPWVRLAYRALHRFSDGIARSFAQNSHDEEFLRFLRQEPLQSRRTSMRWVGALIRWIPQLLALGPSDYEPLVIQGNDDDTVDWRYNIPRITELFPRVRVKYIEGGRHQLANESPQLRRHIARELDEYFGAH